MFVANLIFGLVFAAIAAFTVASIGSAVSMPGMITFIFGTVAALIGFVVGLRVLDWS